MYSIIYVTLHDIVHIDGSITWHWLMRCHNFIGENFYALLIGDMAAYQWTKNRAYGTCIYSGLFSTNPRHYSDRLTVQTVSLFKLRTVD